MKGKKDDLVKGRFTRYVETAVKRSRKDYINREQKRKELSADLEIWEEAGEDQPDIAGYNQEGAEKVSWETEEIKGYLRDCLDSGMWNSLSCLTDLELQVVFAKVFRELTFTEIGKILRCRPEKIADTYSYARKKIRKGWKKNGNGRIIAPGKNGR